MAGDDKRVGIDTGTPGFDIDGTSRTFDPVEPGQQGVDPIPTDRGDMHVDRSQRDLDAPTKRTLGDYLGRSTSVNRYAVDGTIVDASISTQHGTPTPLGPSENSDVFVDRNTLDRQSSLRDDPRDQLRGSVSKGRESPGLVDGNDLLRTQDGAKITGRYVSSVLSNNRFTPTASAVPDGVDISSPGSKFDPILISPTVGSVSAGRLAQVAGVLSLRASKEIGSDAPGLNPSSARTEGLALLPSSNQLGASNVETTLLRARDVLENLTDDVVGEGTLLSISARSYGQLNNVDDTFTGFGALGMIGLSAALTSAVLVAFEGLAAFIGVVSPAPPQERAVEGRYLLGRSSVEKRSNPSATSGIGSIDLGAGNFVPSMLGIRSTVKPFSDAVRKGVEVYFGFETSLLDGLKQSIASPGHSIVVARAIIRSSTIVLDSIKSAFRSGNAISGAKSVLSIIDAIRGSKFIAAANVFAQLGDVALTESVDDIIPTAPGEPIKKSRIDAIPDGVPGFAVSKNRLNTGRTKLAWAGNTAPSSYMLPTRILGLTLANKLGGFQTGYGLQEAATRSKYKLLEVSDSSAVSGRIPRSSAQLDDATVDRIESELEAEYVPFSFHDLRTNEIVSFHAFISTLTEAYAPAYESIDGFGRTDPVQIYKNTKRTINLRFSAVSTSPDDFNDMWVKINKLVTLVYPQYTQGRVLSTEGYEFVQPFSQMMGASPMVRLRIGDLIRSNYSRFALARLFGAGTKETLKLNDQTVDFKLSEDSVKQKIEELKRTEQRGWYVSTDGVSVDSVSLNLPAFGSVSKEFASTFKPGPDAAYLPVVIDQFVDDGDAVIVRPQVIDAHDLVRFYGFSASAAQRKIEDLNALYANPRAVRTRYVGGKYKVHITSLRMSPMLASNVIDKLSSTVSTKEALDALHEFMDPEKNAIVKSFESVGGKGLAGFIASMDIDWMENVTWEIDPGSKAPKMCTVTMTFSPVHDIAPGLDHFGFTRAPVYPVGWYAPGIDVKGST